jgi:hypothetical protein
MFRGFSYFTVQVDGGGVAGLGNYVDNVPFQPLVQNGCSNNLDSLTKQEPV